MAEGKKGGGEGKRVSERAMEIQADFLTFALSFLHSSEKKPSPPSSNERLSKALFMA
jgi:hypothetical protein